MKNQILGTAYEHDQLKHTPVPGFTLIEMIIVMVLLGVLAATALPRYMEVSGRAHESSVQAIGSAYAASIALTHAQWIANGYSAGADVDDLKGYGEGNINLNMLGWPVRVTSSENGSDLSVNDCTELWGALLQSGAPVISESSDKADFGVSIAPDERGKGGNDCLYTYLQDHRNHTIRYDADNGVVTTVIN